MHDTAQTPRRHVDRRRPRAVVAWVPAAVHDQLVERAGREFRPLDQQVAMIIARALAGEERDHVRPQ